MLAVQIVPGEEKLAILAKLGALVVAPPRGSSVVWVTWGEVVCMGCSDTPMPAATVPVASVPASVGLWWSLDP